MLKLQESLTWNAARKKIKPAVTVTDVSTTAADCMQSYCTSEIVEQFEKNGIKSITRNTTEQGKLPRS